MSPTLWSRKDQPQVITDARRSMSEDIRHRQRHYLVMMLIRVVCFVIAVVVWVNHGGWLVVIPAAAAIAMPYFAVVFANGGREPESRRRGFQEYAPNLPERHTPPSGGAHPSGYTAQGYSNGYTAQDHPVHSDRDQDQRDPDHSSQAHGQ